MQTELHSWSAKHTVQARMQSLIQSPQHLGGQVAEKGWSIRKVKSLLTVTRLEIRPPPGIRFKSCQLRNSCSQPLYHLA